MTWVRPVAIFFLVLAVLAGIAVRVEIGREHSSWLLAAVYVVLGVVAALVSAGLYVIVRRVESRR
ncbi:hypothetical protein [Dactylosporangium darangshiense]|uniref:Uncharacterized protein n=2 Tax=Dactylosporangium darangshiense TaxID=579108 RepID=A0ABP8D817_9ACTN